MSIKTKMTAIANAIRAKTGQASTEKLGLDDMASQITTLAEPFWKDNAKGTTTQEIVVDSDLNVIRPYAFYGLKGVKTMLFQNSELTTIGEGAFKGCSVQNLTLPSGITSLSKEMFAYSSIKSFSAPGVTNVGEGCFKNCYLTNTPTLSENIAEIPKEFCYHDFGYLETLEIPTECVIIGPAAYRGVTINHLTDPIKAKQKVWEGKKVETLGSFNFEISGLYASNIQYYTHNPFLFPKLKKIKHYCFDGSEIKKSGYYDKYANLYYTFSFPKLEEIGHRNFEGIPFKEINNSTFPILTSIGQRCFVNNSYLTYVELNNLTTVIDVSEGTNLSYQVYTPEDYEMVLFGSTDEIISPFSYCENLTRITLPALLRFDMTLEGCTSLTTIELGAVEYFETFETTSLTTLVINNTIPPQLQFRNGEILFPDNITIKVPAESVEVYKTAPNWINYADNIISI